jgi:hypothetical protein
VRGARLHPPILGRGRAPERQERAAVAGERDGVAIVAVGDQGRAGDVRLATEIVDDEGLW